MPCKFSATATLIVIDLPSPSVRTESLLSLRGRRLASNPMLLRHPRPLHHVQSRRPSTGRPALIQPCLPAA